MSTWKLQVMKFEVPVFPQSLVQWREPYWMARYREQPGELQWGSERKGSPPRHTRNDVILPVVIVIPITLDVIIRYVSNAGVTWHRTSREDEAARPNQSPNLVLLPFPSSYHHYHIFVQLCLLLLFPCYLFVQCYACWVSTWIIRNWLSNNYHHHFLIFILKSRLQSFSARMQFSAFLCNLFTYELCSELYFRVCNGALSAYY